MLAEVWNVADDETTASFVNWMLETGSRVKYDAGFGQALHHGNADAGRNIDMADVVRIRHAKQYLLRAGIDEACLSRCRSTLAYDLERAAYVARIAFAVGYIDEAATLAYLRRIATLAKGSFASWEDHFVSHVLSYALFNRNEDYLRKLADGGIVMLKTRSPFSQYASPWLTYPLQEISVLHAVRVAPDCGHGLPH